MDLMKELIEERKDPHNTDIASWRQKAIQALNELKKTVDEIPSEDLLAENYSRARAITVSNYLRDFIELVEKENRKIKPL